MKHTAEQFEFKLAPRAGKPSYSYSQLELAKCGRKYYESKTAGKQIDFTFNLAAGRILDEAFNAYYENNDHLKESHEDRKRYARAAVELLLEENPSWFQLPWSSKAGDVRSSPENYIAWLFDLNALDLVCYGRGPVEVQKRVSLELPDYSIVGYIDCLELDTNTVVDVKSVTGWSAITEFQYALRSQVPLYRMILEETDGKPTKGRYDLLMCRKTPKLTVVNDYNIDFIQAKLIREFDEHHKKLVDQRFDKNPDQCFAFNKVCGAFTKCWPELAALSKN